MEQKKLTIDEFHEVRKILKEFMNVFQLELEMNPQSLTVKEYQYLFNLNEALGALNDSLTVQIVNGDAKTKSRMSYPEDLRPWVEHFLYNVKIPKVD